MKLPIEDTQRTMNAIIFFYTILMTLYLAQINEKWQVYQRHTRHWDLKTHGNSGDYHFSEVLRSPVACRTQWDIASGQSSPWRKKYNPWLIPLFWFQRQHMLPLVITFWSMYHMRYNSSCFEWCPGLKRALLLGPYSLAYPKALVHSMMEEKYHLQLIPHASKIPREIFSVLE